MHVVPLGPRCRQRRPRRAPAPATSSASCRDRDLDGGGVEVEFFGERTTLPGGPATLALRTGAAVFPTAVYFEGSRHRAVVRDPLDLTRTGGASATTSPGSPRTSPHELEELIRARPGAVAPAAAQLAQ